jgi:hypothetical protein
MNAISKDICWNYIPAKGTSGGILVGFRNTAIEIISWQEFNFCAVSIVRNYAGKITWRLIVVYGSPYEESKLEFIKELEMIMGNWQGPTLVGSDFNLVRNQKEKKQWNH